MSETELAYLRGGPKPVDMNALNEKIKTLETLNDRVKILESFFPVNMLSNAVNS